MPIESPAQGKGVMERTMKAFSIHLVLLTAIFTLSFFSQSQTQFFSFFHSSRLLETPLFSPGVKLLNKMVHVISIRGPKVPQRRHIDFNFFL